jgi:hypothetical protein
MTTYYNNLPKSTPNNSANSSVQVFDQYFQSTIELNNSVLTAMRGFFEKRGFGADAAESTAIIILQQATKDNLNAMEIIDTLSGISDVEISALVGEILNYNRLKTSSLGVYNVQQRTDYINRNILA